jgi:hypothetical protein
MEPSFRDTFSEDLVCPHCLRPITTEERRIDVGKDPDSGGFGNWVLLVAHCRNKECQRLIVRLTQGKAGVGVDQAGVFLMQGAPVQVLYPKWPTPRVWPAAVPAELAAMYTTAHHLLQVSPEASAAISRRALQATLRHPQGGNLPGNQDLVTEINAVANNVPQALAHDLHTLRDVGNFAAHPMKNTATNIIEPVEPGEAEYSLDVLAELFEHYFIRTAARTAARARLNQHRQAVGKKPL